MYVAMVKQEKLLNEKLIQQNLKVYPSQNAREEMLKKEPLPRLTRSDLDQQTGMKMVFVTSSPVLTNEVKRYYTTLKE